MGKEPRMKRLWVIVVVASIVSLLAFATLMSGCGTSSETTTTSTSGVATPGGTIKIGMNASMGYPAGLGASRTAQVLADMDNSKGGVRIGDHVYQVEVVVYDAQFTPDVAISNINRMIFQDNIKYVVSDPIVVDPWLPTAEENKVLVCAASSTDPILSPASKYSFQTGLVNSNSPVGIAWFETKYPEKKVLAFASPDNSAGHAFADLWKKAWETFGGTCQIVYYPQTTQDFSALATQIKTSNPDVFSTLGGFNDQAVFKAVAESGYKGSVLSLVPLVALKTIIPMAEMEGWIVKEQPTQFETPTTPFAVEFKEAYTAKYGEWDYPTTIFASGYSATIAAMQKAGSTDADAVAQALGSGLTFDSTEGQIRMVSRPDKGNTRTVDSVNEAYMCEIQNGQEVVVEHVALDQCASWMAQVFGE
jgi:ABC-type branched-subunit amino acid transport system substrate-binding protein